MITCMVEWNHPPTCHPDRNAMEWRDLPKWQALPYTGYYCNLGRFLHSADAAVGMTDRGVIPFCPHRLYVQRGGRLIAAPTCTLERSTVHSYGLYSLRCLAMNHRRYIAWFHSFTRLITRTSPERHIGRSLRFRWWGCFFNRRVLKTSAFRPKLRFENAKLSIKRITVNCPLSTKNNCQLSIVNCQFSSPSTLRSPGRCPGPGGCLPGCGGCRCGSRCRRKRSHRFPQCGCAPLWGWGWGWRT